jgi:hypothetical protein
MYFLFYPWKKKQNTNKNKSQYSEIKKRTDRKTTSANRVTEDPRQQKYVSYWLKMSFG